MKNQIEAVALPVEVEFSDVETMEESFAAATNQGSNKNS